MLEEFEATKRVSDRKRCRLLRLPLDAAHNAWRGIAREWHSISSRHQGACESDQDDKPSVAITYTNPAKLAPGTRALAACFRFATWLLEIAYAVVQVLCSRRAGSIAKHAALVLVAALYVTSVYVRALHGLAERRAVEEEAAACHVCLDTSTEAQPPCAPVTIADFTTHRRQMDALVTLMTEHIQHDNHVCIAASHIGSQACAVGVHGIFSTRAYFNPNVTAQTWSTPPKRYRETSDEYGTTAIRERPDSITLSYASYDAEKQAVEVAYEVFVGEQAACVVHGIEVLDGTHAKWHNPDGQIEL